MEEKMDVMNVEETEVDCDQNFGSEAESEQQTKSGGKKTIFKVAAIGTALIGGAMFLADRRKKKKAAKLAKEHAEQVEANATEVWIDENYLEVDPTEENPGDSTTEN